MDKTSNSKPNLNRSEVEQILNKYRSTVYTLAISYMKNKYDADDIYQNVFLRYIKYRPTFNDCEHEKAWFIRTTINCCKTMYSSSWYKKEIITDEIDKGTYEESFMDNEMLKTILTLPKKYSTVIHLFYYEEYSVNEIANILEKSVSSVTTILSRGRKMLKEILCEEGGNKAHGI